MTPALRSALPLLSCPHRPEPLHADGDGLLCESGHRFDVARQGYVNLLASGSAHASDTAAMIAARVAVLSTGRYAPIADALSSAVVASGPRGGGLLDLGGGTGYYAARVLDALPQAVGVSLDLSKYAARRAARAHPRLASVVADAWARLPLSDEAFDVVLSVFAPRNVPEIVRVLRPGRALVVATPEPAHLVELVGAVDGVELDPRKQERLHTSLADAFEDPSVRRVEETLRLGRHEARDLVLMGPTAFHRTAEEIERALADLPDPLAVSLDVTVQTFVRR